MTHELNPQTASRSHYQYTQSAGAITATIILFLSLLTCTTQSEARQNYAAIIIDDLGNNLAIGKKFLDLPNDLTYSILPYAQHARQLAQLVHRSNKEVMLHLPLQSIASTVASKGNLDLHMTHTQFTRTLTDNLNALPFISGVNNHMGSLLTQHPGHMGWLMSTLATREGLYFIDSRTTDRSIAYNMAIEHGVPALKRDIFIDASHNSESIGHEFSRFIELIKSRGYGVAIAHPNANTLRFLKHNLVALEIQNIQVVPISRLLRITRDQKYVSCTNPACTGL